MLIAGSDDGVYRVEGLLEDGDTTVERVLDAGRTMRVREFAGADGVFAATETGLYRSRDGETWTDLGVPREQVYAVAAAPDGRLYAGTRPAAVYAAPSVEGEWHECEAFQSLPSREEWRLPRHENLAQVRDVRVHPDAPDRVVAGIEVGGVAVSTDRGETWTERKDGVDDDIHHLHVPERDSFVAATGFGLYRSTDVRKTTVSSSAAHQNAERSEDAGRSWTRLDEGFDQRYVREAFTHDGTLYAGAAPAHPATWAERSNHALFEVRDGAVRSVDYPTPEEVPIGFCAAEGRVVAATHRGTLLVRRDDGWERAGSVPTPGEASGRYLPLCWRG